jgi:hypothetical protein
MNDARVLIYHGHGKPSVFLRTPEMRLIVVTGRWWSKFLKEQEKALTSTSTEVLASRTGTEDGEPLESVPTS